jgi:hypothetical protein
MEAEETSDKEGRKGGIITETTKEAEKGREMEIGK